MSVIGRLDEQVDAILISPLARKGEPQTPLKDSQAQPAPAQTIPVTSTPDKVESSGNQRHAGDELPVWLL